MKTRYLPVHLVAVAFFCCSVGSVFADAETKSEAAESTVTATYKENVTVERTTTVREVAVTPIPKVKKAKYACAIFVANRSDKISDKKVLVLQDFLTGHATDDGFTIIAREDVINAVDKLAPDAGPNKGNKALPGANMDEALSNNTSALHLAQNLNADYVLMVTITSYGVDTQRYHDGDINLVGKKYQLKTTFRLLDCTVGGSMTAGVATAVIRDRTDPRNGGIDRENVVDDLLDGASLDMSAMLRKAIANDRIMAPADSNQKITFEVVCGMADLVIPEVIKDEKGEYVVSAGRYHLEPMAVTVELDGIVIGTTTDQDLPAHPGLHKLRLRRALFNDWEGTVNLHDKQVLQIAMHMTDDGLAKFKNMTAFLNDLKTNEKLNDAQVKLWESYGKYLENLKVRTVVPGDKVDVKVNIHHAPPAQ